MVVLLKNNKTKNENQTYIVYEFILIAVTTACIAYA
jgi:hypothetical protein